MGRTIPSFRIASMMEQNEWKVFRKSLNKSDRKVFDNMFDIAHLYNSAYERIIMLISFITRSTVIRKSFYNKMYNDINMIVCTELVSATQ
jgi:hypothetical protein